MRFQNQKYFVFIVLLLSGCSATDEPKLHGNIKSCSSFTQAAATLNSCSADDLVLFDVDETLFTAVDMLPRFLGELPWWFKIGVVLGYPQCWQKDFFTDAITIMLRDAKRVLVEPEIPNIIQSLQKRDVPVLALTSMESGGFGNIASMPVWRANMLHDFGITMSQVYPDTIFTALPMYRNNHPVLYQGIMCCNQQPKGVVLEAFLQHCKLKPKRIVFFDDNIHSVQSVAECCKKHNIAFEGFEYRGAEALGGIWDTQQALRQLDLLLKEHRWVSDHALNATRIL